VSASTLSGKRSRDEYEQNAPPSLPMSSTLVLRSAGSSSIPHINKIKKQANLPIIIVPAALTSILTLYNVKSFLSNGEYIDTQTLRKQQHEKKPTHVVITPYTKNTNNASQSTTMEQYEVIDNATHLRPADWERVVAVFALGQPWQFRDWLWHEAVTLFHNGMHLFSFLCTILSFLLSSTLSVTLFSPYCVHVHTDTHIAYLFFITFLNSLSHHLSSAWFLHSLR
jgi:hypothetical protein